MARSRQQDWYSVSEETLRALAGVLLLAGLVVVGFVGYREWESHVIEQGAVEVVGKSRGLLKRLRSQPEIVDFESDYAKANELYRVSKARLDEQNFKEAYQTGQEAKGLLDRIAQSIELREQGGVGMIVRVSGLVEVRRGQRGAFFKAKKREQLFEGDYVRTGSSGSAEIYFHFEDAQAKVDPLSYIKISRHRAGGQTRSIGNIEYGLVRPGPANKTSGVTTRHHEVVVKENSQATVAMDRESGTAQVTANRGRLEIKSVESGEVQRLQEREHVAERGSRLSDVKRIPDRVTLLEPPDDYNVDIDVHDRVVLAWQPVDGAERYALQVSPSRSFGEKIIDVADRRATRATVGIRGEGIFLWRVAAVDGEGVRGAWSDERRFRIASLGGSQLEADDDKPELSVDLSLTSGNVVIVEGETEPGVRLTMNGKTIDVAADGSFQSVQSFDEEGIQTLEFVAVDEAGNRATVSRTVSIDL